MKLRNAQTTIIIVALAFVFVQCGGKTENTVTQEEETVATRNQETLVAEQTSIDEVTLELNAGDMLQFDKTELRVKEGQEVTLTLNHTGQMPKEGMGHNFVLLKPGTDIAAFASEALNARENEYIPEGEEAVIVHTKLIGGGESDTITFTAPPKGTYDFICSFPGHYALMKGKFIVE